MKTRRNLAELPPMPDDEEVAKLLLDFAASSRAARRVFADMLGTNLKVLGQWTKGTSFPGDNDKQKIGFLLRPF